MSTNPNDERSREKHDPTKDKYLELDKKLGTAEYALAADIAAGNKAFDGAMKTARQQIRSAMGHIRPGRGKGRS